MCTLRKNQSVNHGIIKDFFATMNTYRLNHCVPPLEYCDELEETAAKAVKTAIRLNKVKFRITEPIQCGENISRFLKGENNITGSLLAASWYIEGRGYNYKSEEVSRKTGLFTQMIWAASQYVGISIQISSEGDVFYAAHFRPKGNICGFFEFNVIARRNDYEYIETINEVNLTAIRRINFYRLKHQSPPLCLSLDLMKTANERADLLVKNKTKSTKAPYCNVWESSHKYYYPPPEYNYETVIDYWYGLGNIYDFMSQEDGEDTNYFTKLICKDSKFAGFSLAVYKGCHVFVAHFHPTTNAKVNKPH